MNFAEPGALLNYTVQASNYGSVTAYGVVITDVLPSDLTLVGIPTPAPDIQNGQTLVWTSLGPIPPDGSAIIHIPVMVNIKAPYGAYLQNNMAVEYTNPVGHLYAIQTAFDTTSVTAPLFTVSKSASPDPIFVGQPIIYTIAYANVGSAGATNGVITDTVPMSTTYQSCSGAPCSMSSGLVTWQVGDIPENSGGTVSLTVLVDDSLPKGSVISNDNYGIVSDQTYFLAGAPVTTPVNMLADLVIDKLDAPDPVMAGGVLTYTLNIANQGPSIAENVIITDELPSKVTFNSVISQPASFSGPVQIGQMLTWTAPLLLAGENGAIVYRVLVDPDASDPLVNVAGISSTTADPDLDNNRDIEHTMISSPNLANIYGLVYEDTNGNGVKDPGENGIPDVVITMDGFVTATTASDGWYNFITAAEGMHTLVESDPVGYFSTTPNEVQVFVSLGNSYRVDYGDFALCTCPPDNFENDDSQAEAKPISVGLSGLQERTFCDDATDWITFTAEARGVYTITTDSYGQRADTFLALYDRDGQTLLAANDDYLGGSDYSSQVVYETPAAGNYFINVTNRAGSTCCQTNYKVWVTAHLA
ncbi:MAG TPA: SdrD B-like domain-containing protein, partial [Anaerolineales bacterium]